MPTGKGGNEPRGRNVEEGVMTRKKKRGEEGTCEVDQGFDS